MGIAKNSVVTLNYEMFDANDQLIDKTEQPIAYLHGGYDGIFPLVEEALHGKEVGGTVDVVAVYEHLARLSDLRRAVGQGFKAVQRMAALPELSTLSHGAPTLPAAESDSGRSVESAE